MPCAFNFSKSLVVLFIFFELLAFSNISVRIFLLLNPDIKYSPLEIAVNSFSVSSFKILKPEYFLSFFIVPFEIFLISFSATVFVSISGSASRYLLVIYLVTSIYLYSKPPIISYAYLNRSKGLKHEVPILMYRNRVESSSW